MTPTLTTVFISRECKGAIYDATSDRDADAKHMECPEDGCQCICHRP